MGRVLDAYLMLLTTPFLKPTTFKTDRINVMAPFIRMYLLDNT